MADDLSLLLKIRGDSSGGKTAVAETRAAVAQLRTSVGSEMNSLRVSTTNAAQGTSQLTNGFQALTSAITVIDGPLGGVASRFRAMGTVASEANQIINATGAEATTTGASIAAMAGPIGLAIAATAALAGGLAFVTKALFDLAVTAADFRGKMFDLSQQTGVAVETLSTLEVIAKTTGGSIESIAQSLVIFQGHLDEAQDATSKMGIKFKELKISTDNTEKSFRDALKVLAEMPEGFEQTNEAAELFGRRGGKQVLAILKEMAGGDLDQATAKLRQLGLVISEEDAKAADEFNDQLAILNFQFRAALGQDVIPAALVALKSLSNLLSENREVIKGFGQTLGLLSNTILPGFLFQLHQINQALIALEIAAKVLDKIRGNITPGLTGGAEGVSALAGLTGSAAAVEAAKKVRTATGGDPANAAVRLAALRLQATLAGLTEEDRVTRRSLDQRKIDFERYALEVKFIEDRRHFSVMAGLIAEEEAAKNIRNGLQRDIALKEIENKKLEENNRHKAAGDDLDDRRAKIQKEIADTIEKLNRSTALYVGTVDKYQQAVDDLVASLAKQGVTLDPLIEQTLRFDAAMAGARDRTLEALKALEDLSNAPPPPGSEGVDLDAIAQAAGAVANGELGPPPVKQEVIDSWAVLGNTAMSALSSMAQGVGQLAQSWVLYGNVGPNAMRKLVASVLAGVAAQAAILAVMELAYGLAALTPWGAAIYGPAPFHFKSAALFGSIAVGAAIAGRVVAGDAFAPQGASSGGSTGTGGGSGSTSAPLKPTDIDRRGNLQTQTIAHELTFKVKGDVVIDKWVQDYDLNGRTRIKIYSDGQG